MTLIKVKAKNLEIGDVFVGLEDVYREPINGKVLEMKVRDDDGDFYMVIEVNSSYQREILVNKNSKATISTLRK